MKSRSAKELEQLQNDQKASSIHLWDTLQTVDGVNLLVGTVTGASAENLREMADWFRDRVGSGVAVLATVKDDLPLLVAVVTQDVIKRGVKAEPTISCARLLNWWVAVAAVGRIWLRLVVVMPLNCLVHWQPCPI